MHDPVKYGTIFKSIINESIDFSSRRCTDYKGIVDKQEPQITLLTCSDSRVPIDCLISDSLNKAFVVENIGNQVRTSAGSLDYSILHLKTPLLLILGHTNCGAIAAAVHDYKDETDDIKKELRQIEEGLAAVGAGYSHDDRDWLNKYSEKNVDYQVMTAVKKYRALVDSGKLFVIGMMLDFAGSYGPGIMTYVTNINSETRPDIISKDPMVRESGANVRRLT